MAVPKKRTSLSKKRIRKNIWKRKGYWAARKAFSLAKSLFTGNSKGFCGSKEKSTRKPKGFGTSKEKYTRNPKGFGTSKEKYTGNAKFYTRKKNNQVLEESESI
uniref:ribosomal protein L32 n=1 Tax=Corydalis speciosa TaxID=1852784 RepID=UPI0023D834C2|nr:ribosomal protein L32 [Corydalis speciosa]YP_010712197.1 ribosomal protein L32 [Corydalis speciosa]WDA92835.1 ribosomal protein L32 [Corydalis speciosa]WDA92852.1 ribosomal protein L32 [Corydalis speciosa]